MDAYQLKARIEQNPDAKLKDLVQELLYDEIVSLRILPGSPRFSADFSNSSVILSAFSISCTGCRNAYVFTCWNRYGFSVPPSR